MITVTPLGFEDHVREALALDARAYVDLFTIELNPPGQNRSTLYLSPKNVVQWQGKTWEDFPCSLQGYANNSSGEASRPKFSIVNPDGLFSKYIHELWMDNAFVTRYRVLMPHLQANLNSYVKNTWRVSKILSLTKAVAVFELRGALDGPLFLLPGRAYYPPEFPSVSLG